MERVSIAYNGDGIRRTWFIPFPYGDLVRDIGVSLTAAGVETTLVYGSGFTVSEHCVVCAVPNGAILRIWLKSASALALAGQEERARAAEIAGLNEDRAAWHAEAASQLALEACLEASEKIKQNVAAAESQITTVRQEALEVAAQAENTLEAKAKELEGLAKAARQAFTRLYEKAVAALSEKAVGWLEQASLSGLNPVPEKAGLGRYSHGFCLVLPFGMFPVQHKSQIKWDGFFVVIPSCPGHGGTQSWTKPQPGLTGSEANANGSWWIPCGHEHKGLA